MVENIKEAVVYILFGLTVTVLLVCCTYIVTAVATWTHQGITEQCVANIALTAPGGEP